MNLFEFSIIISAIVGAFVCGIIILAELIADYRIRKRKQENDEG